jgi:PAP2 superfamily protein
MKSINLNFTLVFLFAIMLVFNYGCTPNSEEKSGGDYTNGNFISELNANLTDAIIIDLFSPPVASRIYIYPNIAAYEVLVNTNSDYQTMAGRLHDLTAVPVPDKDVDINYAIAALVAFTNVGKQLVYTEAEILSFKNHKLDSLKNTGIADDVYNNSIAYGNKVAQHILTWADGDSYKETRSAERYSLLNTEGSWLPTPPDYSPAMEPHWAEIRPFIIESATAFAPDSLPTFSTDPSSEFYKMNTEVYDAVNLVDSDQVSMAKFWDDNPVVSEHTGHMMVKNKKMTPGGHWLYIASLAVKDSHNNMLEAANTYVMTTVSLADAFISSFQGKYYFQSIRPVTYINDHISADWQPILQTPPFPEYPSAHSTISASAATVLTHIYGDNFAFTDSSELPFDLPVRSFISFHDAADEVALSRFYGGIHYTLSNEVGIQMGHKVGETVLEKLQNNVPLTAED